MTCQGSCSGNRGSYVAGCRLAPCTEANRRYQKEWRVLRLAAGWRLLHGRWVQP